MSSKDQSSTECSDKVSPRYVILQFTGIIRYICIYTYIYQSLAITYMISPLEY